MPELPEVEVARRDLEREVAGRKFKSAEVREKKTVRRHKTRPEYEKLLAGRKVKSFDRRGLFLIGKLDSDDVLVINMGSSGYLRRVKGGKPKADSDTKIIWTFSQGGGLLLGDPRSKVESFVVPKAELVDVEDFAEMGLDPLESPVPWQQFGAQLMRNKSAKLKATLQNERVIAGLGAVYSDEILHNAGLLYDRTPDTLSAHEIRRLYRGMIETMTQAVKFRGVSIDDNELDIFGNPGEFGSELAVFGRYGESCARCRGEIDRVKFQKRYHFYCPNCQS